ncbi:MAG TPA: SDR family NAD(P)-dependent oxidoreductase [Acidimicrobiales bacterium]|nr:SDR family NAD(P)-dependent oxidoreductase [Acidimicrobiales bacterium]
MTDAPGPDLTELEGRVAVVTGGANGIGRAIVEALLDEGATVVIADIEEPVLEATVAELSARGTVVGVRTDVSDPDSVAALADAVYDQFGACHLLFNNAGVTSGGGGKPWEQEYNDFRWCFGVNVFGSANGCSSFVPRMIASGEPGRVINTSSGDGGFAPVPRASVYAASKAAVTCFTEALAHNLISEETNVRASVFYPSGGLMDTGLFTANRNRPDELARRGAGTGRRSMTFDELKAAMEKSGREVPVADLAALGRFVVAGVKRGDFIIAHGLDETAELLHRRADAIAKAELPPHHQMGI